MKGTIGVKFQGSINLDFFKKRGKEVNHMKTKATISFTGSQEIDVEFDDADSFAEYTADTFFNQLPPDMKVHDWEIVDGFPEE